MTEAIEAEERRLAGAFRRLRRRSRSNALRPGALGFAGDLPELPNLGVGGGLVGRLRAASRLTQFALLTLIGLPFQGLALLLDRRLATAIPFIYHRLLCRILGLRLVVRGRRHKRQSVLFVANHSSWLDIPVLSAVIPGSFVAKTEVAGWPIFGQLAKLQRTVFVERERRARTGDSRDEIAARLDGGDSLILFPEGTSSDGNRVLPFKSALFGAAEIDVTRKDGPGPVIVQPVSVAYTRLSGLPIGRDWRPFFTWFGDMELAPHLWRALQFGPITVEIEFHAPLSVREAGSRKALARHCERAVRGGFGRAIQGRGA